MRKTRTVQPSVFQAPEIVHPVAAELERSFGMARSTPRTARHDRHLRAGLHLLRSPWPDLRDHSALCGAHASDGLHRGLEFALLDSASVQRFARVDPFRVPKKSALQSAVGAIDADTWQAINGVLLQDAKQRGIESGTQARIDSTVTETDILSRTAACCTTGCGC